MTKQLFWANALILALIFTGYSPGVYSSGEDAVITTPKRNTLIEHRLNFPVAGSIKNFDKDRAAGLHYWISIEDPTMNLHWPKFYVKNQYFRGNIFDGGQNFSPDPQPMKILLLRVDGATSQSFVRWIKRGQQVGYWPGLQVKQNEIVTNVPILFP